MRNGHSVDMVLAGDIGGTNARLRLYDRKGERVAHEAILPSAGAPSLSAIVSKYLGKRKTKVASAVLGIAGPVVDGVARPTNLPWVIDQRELSAELGIPKVSLLNDLAAVAIGCTRLARASRIVIAKGKAPKGGNIAVIAAGTGLGEALLIWDGDHYVPCATEGGHTDFAPTSDLEVDLLAFLRRRLKADRVSYERVLSGPGLGNLYDFFVERHGGELPAVERRLAKGDRNATISALGLAKKSRPAADAVDLFAGVYGAEAGNLALKGLSLGGVFLSGRIATDIIPRKKALFLQSMRDKGRMGELLARVPVTISKDRLVGLTGAGYLAARLVAA
ncbi:MAG TPA: glucokinase [Polyangiaceae bacterium]|nr:glucokinase [Polyangiaceae bacterium]